ncbi:MAG: hypothetical protein H7Y07_12815 [Pyrinomonadaceae bacterium]|nr:hypothetical protein [Sphingobacteriaceae bacterium]
MPIAKRLPADYLKAGDINSILELKKIAWACLYAQFGTSFIYFLSFLLLPESHSTAVICGVLAILVSLTPIVYVFITKRFELLFSCISIFNIAPIWFLYLEAVIPGYDAYVYSPPAYRMEAFFWISVFLIFINLLYILLWKKGTQLSIRSFSFLKTIKFKPNTYAWLTIASFFIPLMVFAYLYGSFDALWKVLTAGRAEGGSGSVLMQESVGNASSFMLPLKWWWELTPLLGAIAFISAKHKYNLLAVFSLLLGLTIIFIYFLAGSRGAMMFVAAPPLFFLFYYNWQKGIKFWIVASVLLFLLIAVMEMQVRFRGNLLDVIANPEKAARENDLKSATTFDPSKSHRDNNTYLFCLLIKGYPDKYEYHGFNDLLATLVNPIPRAIWPGKPILNGAKDISYQSQFVLDGPLFMGTTSLTFSVVGEAYIAKGIWGLLVYGLIYSLFLLFFDGIIYYAYDKQALTAGMLGVGVFLSFWGFRSFFALVSLLYPLLLFIIAMRLVKLFK